MPNTGEFFGTTSNPYVKPCIRWSAVQVPAENLSLVTAVLSYSRTNTGYKTESTWYGSLTVGTTTLEGKCFATVTYQSDTVVLTAENIPVYHDSQGACSVEISAEGYFFNTSTSDTRICATVTLEPITQAACVAAPDSPIGGICPVTVTGLAPDRSYTLAYSFGGLSGFVDEAGQLSDTPHSLTAGKLSVVLPESFYDEIPQSREGACVLTCQTFLDGTAVGQTQCTFAAYCRPELCAPVLSGTVEENNPQILALTGDKTTLIAYASDALCTLECHPRYGAAITQKRIDTQPVPENSLLLQGFSGETVTFWVRDSRGFEASCTVSPQVLPYLPLTLTGSARRLGPTSDRVEVTVSGQCYCGALGNTENLVTLSCLADGVEAASLTPQMAANTFRATFLLEGLGYESGHTLALTAADVTQRSQTIYLSVGRGVPVFDWGEGDFTFHVPVNFRAGLQAQGIWEAVYPVGSVYISTAPTDPGLLFGGSWERLEDVFLLAAGSQFPAGATGGEAAHTLTEAELPAHSHGLVYSEEADGVKDMKWLATHGSGSSLAYGQVLSGGGQAHNNLPPYLAVYMWQRLA